MKLVSLLAVCLLVLAAVAGANQNSTPTTPSTVTTTTSTPAASPTSTETPAVLNVVEITRSVPAGTTAVTAFTVPAGQTLIVTDVLVTNTAAAPVCGAAINRAGGTATPTTPTTTPTTGTGARTTTGTTTTSTTTTTTPTTTVMPPSTIGATPTTTMPGTPATPGTTVPTVAGTITQSDSSITGPLCVAPRTTTALPLTTGIEFGPGQTVQLLNVLDTTTSTPAAAETPAAVGFHLRGMLIAAT